MSDMDRNTLRSLLQKMEKEAQRILSGDGSSLEALQALKWRVDGDARVQAATRALRDEGTSAFTSFVPRIRIRLHAGKTALAIAKAGGGPTSADGEELDRVSQIPGEPLTAELREAASAAVAASPYCRHLDAIINEAVRGNGRFERLAVTVEHAGYEVQMSVDLAVYAQVRGSSLTAAKLDRRSSLAEPQQLKPLQGDEPSHVHFSGADMQFLGDLGITLE